MKKHCLFCNERAEWTEKDGKECFEGCMCAPDTGYVLFQNVYETIRLFPYDKKIRLLPLVSASIRAGRISSPLSALDIERVGDDPSIPGTAEEKGTRLLQYLRDNSAGNESGISLHPLARHYNLAYCSTLQEFVYLIERLKDDGMLVREGALLRLTELGSAQAAARSGGSSGKLCTLLIGDDAYRQAWTDSLLPGIEQCGFRTQLYTAAAMREQGEDWLERLAGSKLIVADITGAGPELYYAAGYARRAGISIIYTINDSAPKPDAGSRWFRPLPWGSVNGLMDMLRERL